MPKVGLDPAFIQSIVGQLQEMAAEAGTACSIPGCSGFTLGTRCFRCARRLCTPHSFFSTIGGKIHPYCVYCVVDLCESAFEDVPHLASGGDEHGEEAAKDPDVIDAEFEDVPRGGSRRRK